MFIGYCSQRKFIVRGAPKWSCILGCNAERLQWWVATVYSWQCAVFPYFFTKRGHSVNDLKKQKQKKTTLLLNVLIAKIAFLSDKCSAQVGRARRTKTSSLEAAEQTSRTRASKAAEDAVGEKQDFKVNEEGRYVCPMCDKTFKTVSRPLHSLRKCSLCCIKEMSLNTLVSTPNRTTFSELT